MATLFGDEIAIRAQTLVHDAGNRTEVMQDVVIFATAGREAAEREQIFAMIEQGAEAWADNNHADLGSVSVPIVGLADLIANKRASGRKQDLADLEVLELSHAMP